MNFYFIGVTTGRSAITQIMPLWSKFLSIDLNLVGIDLPMGADRSQYRTAISNLKDDSKAIGAVVTAHKLNVFEHASDLFADLNELAEITKEIGMIRKENSRLVGLALPDCLSNTMCLKKMLGPDYWRKHSSEALCFGAGGVARAITLSLLLDFESDNPLACRRKVKPQKWYQLVKIAEPFHH